MKNYYLLDKSVHVSSFRSIVPKGTVIEIDRESGKISMNGVVKDGEPHEIDLCVKAGFAHPCTKGEYESCVKSVSRPRPAARVAAEPKIKEAVMPVRRSDQDEMEADVVIPAMKSRRMAQEARMSADANTLPVYSQDAGNVTDVSDADRLARAVGAELTPMRVIGEDMGMPKSNVVAEIPPYQDPKESTILVSSQMPLGRLQVKSREAKEAAEGIMRRRMEVADKVAAEKAAAHLGPSAEPAPAKRRGRPPKSGSAKAAQSGGKSAAKSPKPAAKAAPKKSAAKSGK